MKDQFRKCLWIVETLVSTGGCTYKELCRRWEESSLNDLHTRLPRRTFIDYIHDIEMMFDISIVCDASDGYVYRISNLGELYGNRIKGWMLNAFAINSDLRESRALRSWIVFEDVPSGDKLLIPIIKAMRYGRRVDIRFQNFTDDVEWELSVAPYFLRVFRQRWYLIGPARTADGTGIDIQRYPFDRIKDMTVSEQTFVFPDKLSVDEYFKDAFGIIVEPEEYDVEDIDVKVYNDMHKRDYFRTLPLHSSQQEIESTGNYSVFRYHVMPSYDFIRELLSHGEEVEVLRPAYVREQMCKRIRAMAERYAK